MGESKQASRKKHTNEQLIPYQWFWTNVYGERMGFLEWVKSRPFTIFYLFVVFFLFGFLGEANTRHCDTWQEVFACDRAIWMIKMVTEPFNYVLSWFTAPFFHNGIDHILFVAIFGFLMPVQSFEVQNGTKFTVIIFFLAYVTVGVFFGVFFNVGIYYWPDVDFFSSGFERNWMGGSVGFYAIIGALIYLAKKPWVLLISLVSFEILNLVVIGISVHISFIHIVSCMSGMLTSRLLRKFLINE